MTTARTMSPDLKGGGLALCALIWALFGLAIIAGVSGNPPDAPHMKIPEPLRIAMWITPAITALAATWVTKLRTLALTLLVVGPLVRAASYLWIWIVYLIPDGLHGRESGWYTAAIHGAMIGIVVLVACIPHRSADLSKTDAP